MPSHPAARPALWAAVVGTALLCPPIQATPEPDCWEEASGAPPGRSETLGLYEPGPTAFRRPLGDGEVCVLTEGVSPFDEHGPRPDWMRPGDRLVLASRTPRRRYTLAITRTSEGFDHDWFVNGTARQLNPRAQTWRDEMLEVAAGYEATRRVRAEEARLRSLVAELDRQALDEHAGPGGTARETSSPIGLETLAETQAPPAREPETDRLLSERARAAEDHLTALDAERRVRELELRVEPHLRRLLALQRRMR